MTRWLLLLLCVSACTSPTQTQTQLVVLVRHAEKATEPASDPPLTDAGLARAEALAAHLADADIDAVITTQYSRTIETGAPTARVSGVEPTIIAAMRGTDHASATAAGVLAAGQSVLVVGHSNTIPSIIAALGGPSLDDLDEREYDTLFVLTVDEKGSRLVTARYGAPDGFD